MARWVLKVWNTFFFLKKGRLHWKGKCRQHKNNHVQINILHFIIHSQIFTQISCLQVQKGKEPQRIEVTVSSTTFSRVTTVVPILHLNPDSALGQMGTGCQVQYLWIHPPCGLCFQKLETGCSFAHVWVSTELNWDSILFQARSAKGESSIAV